MGTILAIDPGNIESGYVVVEHGGEEICRVIRAGKHPNEEIMQMIFKGGYEHMAVEMIAGMGMPVGQEVFDTCFWTGRFWQLSDEYYKNVQKQMIFRREEKLDLCGCLSAKDKNIRQALIDRYGVVGTKANPGFFYGFAKDMWAAMAVAVTYFDKYIKGVRL